MTDTEGLDSTLRKMEAKGIAESIQEPIFIEEKEIEKKIADAEAKKTRVELESAAASISHHINYMRSMSW